MIVCRISPEHEKLYFTQMKKCALLFLLVPLFDHAQKNDLLVLQKTGQNVKTYAAGMFFTVETVYHQWFDGVITAIRNDSVFINGLPFHYKEFATVRIERKHLNYETDGGLLMVAGGGVLLLGIVNGLYRGDAPKDWFTATGFITAGAFLLGGFLLRKAHYKTYHLGNKYFFRYLSLDPNKK